MGAVDCSSDILKNAPSSYNCVLMKNLESNCLKGRTRVFCFPVFLFGKASLSTRSWLAVENVRGGGKRCLPQSPSSNEIAHKWPRSLGSQPSSNTALSPEAIIPTSVWLAWQIKEQNTETKSHSGEDNKIAVLVCLSNLVSQPLLGAFLPRCAVYHTDSFQEIKTKKGKKRRGSKNPAVVIAICAIFVYVDRRELLPLLGLSPSTQSEKGQLKRAPQVLAMRANLYPSNGMSNTCVVLKAN